MSITNSVRNLAPGVGASNYYIGQPGDTGNQAVGTGTGRIPYAPTTFQPAARSGRIRIKATPTLATGTVQIGNITGTDGTTTVHLYPQESAAGAAGVAIDRVIDFISDIPLAYINITMIVGVSSATIDTEITYSA